MLKNWITYFLLILFWCSASCSKSKKKSDDTNTDNSVSSSSAITIENASAEVLSFESIRLTWSEVTGAETYSIFDASNDPRELILEVTEPTVDLNDLMPGEDYTFHIVFNTGSESDLGQAETSASTPAVTATFAGWSHVKALGGRTPVAHATGLSAESPSIEIEWNAMSLSDGNIDGYNVYRSTSTGTQNFSAPIAANLASSASKYIDNDVTNAQEYFYVVRPIINNKPLSTTDSDTEIKVSTPPQNMVLVHRWIANQEMCGLMGKSVDRDNNYRCAYTGPGGTGTHFDFEYSFLADTVELGCNYSPGNVCGGGDCLGTATPHLSVVAVADTVYYDRTSGNCWINTSGTNTWKNANDATLTVNQRAIIAASNPGLPPLSNTSQERFWDTCQALSPSGFTGQKRMLRRKESIALGAWDASLSTAEKMLLEYDATALNTTKACNTNTANGLTFDNNAVPGDLETLPFTLAAGKEMLRTGSNSTANCVSRYGAQDVVGNIWEDNSDQFNAGNGIVTALDASNDDFVGYSTGAIASDRFYNLPNPGEYFLIPLGLPVSTNDDGAILNSSLSNIHNDYIYVDTTGTRISISGCGYAYSDLCGRFTFAQVQTPTGIDYEEGSRCGFQLPN